MVFITRVHSFFGFIMAVLGSHLVSIGFTMGLARVYCSRLQCFISLAHSGVGGGNSPEMPQTLRSSKKLEITAFQSFSSAFPGGGLWAALGLSFLCSPPRTRIEEDITLSGLLWESLVLPNSLRTRTEE